MAYKPSMTWPYIKAKTQLLAAKGFPIERSMRICGVDNPNEVPPQKRFPIETLLSLLDEASDHFNDPTIGLKIGNAFRVSNFGKTGQIFSYCKNIKDVCEFNAKYQHITISIGPVSLQDRLCEKTGRKQFFHRVSINSEDSTAELANEYKQVIDILFGAYATAFRWLGWAGSVEFEAVYFQYSKPDNTDIYTEIFNCPVHFNHPCNAIQFNGDAVNETLQTYDPVKRAQMAARLDAILESATASDGFARALDLTIRQLLSQRRITKPAIADAMNMSETKLNSEMKSAGLKYKSLVNQIRLSIIKEEILAAKSFVEIADLTGYSDQAAFNKACTRLTGMSPSKYRKHILSQ